MQSSSAGLWFGVDQQHVARAAPSRLAKKIARTYKSNGGHHRPQTHRSHAYCTNLKSIGGAVPVGCMLHVPQADNVFDVGSSGLRKLWASDTKFGMLVHLGNAFFVLYEIRGCGALCACSARANAFHLLHFPASAGQTVGTADAKLTGYMYATPSSSTLSPLRVIEKSLTLKTPYKVDVQPSYVE